MEKNKKKCVSQSFCHMTKMVQTTIQTPITEKKGVFQENIVLEEC